MSFIVTRLQRMTRGGIAGLLGVLAFGALGAFLWVARTVNTAPSQCATCHPQLTAMWQRSGGHPAERVTCHECHAQHAELPNSPNLLGFVRDQLIPEKYLSSDERIEARCEGCHGDIRQAETEHKKVVRLNHRVHLVTGTDLQGAPLGLGCLDCHRSIVHDKARLETNRPAMAGCFTGDCHRKDRNKDNCRRCHYQHLAEPGQGVL